MVIRIFGFFVSSISCWLYVMLLRMLIVCRCFRCLLYVEVVVVICIVSLWVGVSMSRFGCVMGCGWCVWWLFWFGLCGVCGCCVCVFWSCVKCLIVGSMNVVVLFELVGFDISRLWLVMLVGIVCCWIGVGFM